MVTEGQRIEQIDLDYIDGQSEVYLKNCIIDSVSFAGAASLGVKVVIENSIIGILEIHSCWFDSGFELRYCIVKQYVDYQMGGHNLSPFVMEGNLFVEFVNFFDCQFDGLVVIKNNTFLKGTNLTGNQGEGFENFFENGLVVEGNCGAVNMDGVGNFDES